VNTVQGTLRKAALAAVIVLMTLPAVAQDSSIKDKESNWLPAPKGKFNPVLRLYWPTKSPPSILDGTWTPPPVRKVK